MNGLISPYLNILPYYRLRDSDFPKNKNNSLKNRFVIL